MPSSIHMSIRPVTINLAPEACAQTALLVQDTMESLSIIVVAEEPENDQSQRPN